MTKHLIIPDVQIKPGNDTRFLSAIGNYIVAKKPDVVVCIGDFADMPSLSSYDVGKKSFEGRRYRDDIQAARQGMEALLEPLKVFNAKMRRTKHQQYVPRLVLTLGNHENRISRATNDDPKLDGTISVDDLQYKEAGWEVYPFLEPVVIDDIAYCHYFTTGLLGRPCSSAAIQLSKKHQSCVSGHQQGFQISTAYKADGTRLTSIIAGSCYEHDELYLGHQGNKHWRGVLMLHNVQHGEFDTVPVPLHYLKAKFA